MTVTSGFNASKQLPGAPIFMGNLGVTTVAATVTMDDTYSAIQLLNGGTATRKVLLPAEKATGGQAITVVNKGISNDFQVKDDSDTTLLQTLRPGEGCIVGTSNAGAWQVVQCFNDQVPVFSQTFVYGEALQIDASFFVAPVAIRVVSIVNRPLVVGSDAGAVTAVMKKAASGTAIASGTALMSDTFDLKATINTNVSGTLSATSSDLDVAAGTAIGIDTTGVMTAARGVVTVAYIMA